MAPRVHLVAAALAALALAFVTSRRTASAALAASTGHATSTFAMTALYAPSTLTASLSGHSVALSWPLDGANGSGYALSGHANGSNPSCSGVTFDVSVGATGWSAGSFSDSRFSPQGSYFCYTVQSTYSGWSSQANNPVAVARLGFFVTAVDLVNNGNHTGCSGTGSQQWGTAGRLDCGDQVVIDFNQPVDTSSGPAAANTVCTRPSNATLWLASTSTGTATCAASEAVRLGSLTGGTVTANNRYTATYAWSNGNTRLTVTIGALNTGTTYSTLTAATWTFKPATAATVLLSAAGSFHICDSNAVAGSDCLRGSAANDDI